jgi:hypothetical protein
MFAGSVIRRLAVLALLGALLSALAPASATARSHIKHSVARLQLLTPAVHAGETVRLDASSSRVRSGRRLVFARLTFGDRSAARLGGLKSHIAHVYRRPGTYTATLHVRDSGGSTSMVKRTFLVAGKDALVYRKSTRKLPSSSVMSVATIDATHESVALRAGVRLPRPGQTLVIAPGAKVPQGLVAVVQSARPRGDGSSSVVARDGALSDIYKKLNVAATSRIGKSLVVSHIARDGRRALESAAAVPFTCRLEHDNRNPFSVVADLSKTAVSTTIALQAKTFQLDVVSRPVFSMKADFKGSADCSLGNYFALNFPVPSVPGLVITVNPYFTLTAGGAVHADVSWHPSFAMDVLRSPSRNANFLQFNSAADASVSGQASLTLEGGVSLTISVAKAAGLQAQLGPEITASASATDSVRDGKRMCVEVDSAIKASVKLFAHVLFANADVILYKGSYAHSTLFRKCSGAGAGAGAGQTISGSGSGIGTSSNNGGTTLGGTGSTPGGPSSVSVSNNNGQMAVQLSNFPLGTVYYFCHAGSAAEYPTGGAITNRGQFNLATPNQFFTSGLCSGQGNSWIGLQAPDGHDYYSNQTDLETGGTTPGAAVSASNNNGQMAVQLSNFPSGTTYFFCHSGNPSDYPTGGVVTNHGQFDVTSPNQSFASGLCSGRGNAWIGLQATDGHDYYSNQVGLEAPATPGASVSASNNNGQMAVQLTGFPQGTTYFFCHSGNPSDYPTGGVITNHGQFNVTSPNQSFASGLCSGRGNAWIGLQATDGHDYYSNQVDLYAPATPGASISAFGSNGQLSAQVTGFPQGTTYYFCHSGSPSEYPTGGTIIGHAQFNVTSPNQTFGPLCSGSGNVWIGVQATDGHDYYSNQITL